MKKKYALTKIKNLLVAKAAVGGLGSVRIIKLLVDSGSSYTILPVDVLEAVGCSPADSSDRVRIITGCGYLIVPVVKVTWLNCLG